MVVSRLRRLGCLVGVLLVLGAGSPAIDDERLEAAKEAYASGDFAAASKLARKVLKKQPDNALAHYIAGAAGLMLGTEKVGKADAEEHLERALEIEPGIPGVHYLLGYHLYQEAQELDGRGKSEKASEVYADAAKRFEAELAISPGYPQAVEGLALALAGLPEPERAIEAHEIWIEASPGSVSAYLSLATVLIASGRFNEAVAQLDRLPPGSQDAELSASFEMALEMYRSDNKDQAAEAVRALADRSSEDWHRHAMLVLEHVGQKRFADAADALILFMECDPPVEAMHALIDAYIEDAPILDLAEAQRRARDAGPLPDDGSLPVRIAESYRQPIYPDPARRAGIESRVKMLCVIRRDGTPLVIFAKSNRPRMGFEEAATKAVEQWRYRPAMEEGEPVDTVITVIVGFSTM